MKRSALGWIIGVLIVIFLILIVIPFINNPNLTGNVVDNEVTLINTDDLSEDEKIIVDEQKLLDRGKYYIQNFYVSEDSKTFISIDSDDTINYILLPESEVERYKLDKSFESYETRSRIVFLQKTYALDTGQYSVVISSMTKPVNIHLIVKEIKK